jgi:hypothetical protein
MSPPATDAAIAVSCSWPKLIVIRGPVHLIQALRLGVEGLEVLVRHRPGRRQTAVVLNDAEVLGPQTEERGALELGVAAHVIVLLRREFVVVVVDPLLRREEGSVCPTAPASRPACGRRHLFR